MENLQTTTISRGRPRTSSSDSAIVRWLLDYLDRENLSVSRAASKIGVGQSTLSDWLRGAKHPGHEAISSLISLGMPREVYLESAAQAAEKKLPIRR